MSRVRKLAPIIVLTIALAMSLVHNVFAGAGSNNMYNMAEEVGRIAVYVDESSVAPGSDAILVTKNSNGTFTNQGSACPIFADEAARWLGVDAQDMKLKDTGYEKFWEYKSADGKLKRVRVPFGSFQDYRGTYSGWSNINADSGTWRCAPSQTNVVNDPPMPIVVPCPQFAGQPTVLDNGNCRFGSIKDPVRGLVPFGFTADYWDSQNAKTATADEVRRSQTTAILPALTRYDTEGACRAIGFYVVSTLLYDH
jgi:hypothetical protein